MVIFYEPDVLFGLFTLASFDEIEWNDVFAPFSAGCGSIVLFPYLETKAQRPRGVIGMFMSPPGLMCARAERPLQHP